MPVQALRVINHGRVSDGYMWNVADVLIRDVGTPSRRLPNWDVWFKRFDFDSQFYCECTPIAPGAVPPKCEHIYTALFHITRVRGPWEEDRVLMEKAWELVSGRKREKPDLQVRMLERQWGVSGNEDSDFTATYQVSGPDGGVVVRKGYDGGSVYYECRCREQGSSGPCDHIQAVIAFEQNTSFQVVTKGRWAFGGVVKNKVTDEASRQFQESKKAFLNELAKVAKVYRDTADQNDLRIIVDGDEPKKPKSRFSEIDL